jgi:deoxyuridine 5'-triphosphate nucleotidohydrolase
MDRSTPTFTGYTANESIIAFIDQFQLFAAVKGFDADRQRTVLEVALHGPAQVAFRTAIMNADIPPVVGPGPGALFTPAQHLEACFTWLRTQYHTEDMRQGIKDQIIMTFQGLTESPLAYYTKLRHLIDLAGYDPAVKDQVAEAAFMSGLQREIALHIRSSLTPLTLPQKVDGAHRYWTARNPTVNTFQQVLDPNLRNAVQVPPPPTIDHTMRPAQVDWANYQKKEDPGIAELTDAMAKMTAHVAKLTEMVQEKPKRNYMTNQPGNGRRRPCKYCGEDHLDWQCPTPIQGFAPRVPGCYNCGKPGHIATYCSEPRQVKCHNCGEQGHYANACQTETSKKAAPSQKMQQQSQQQHNVVQFESEEEDESIYFPEDVVDMFPAQNAKPGRPKKAVPYARPIAKPAVKPMVEPVVEILKKAKQPAKRTQQEADEWNKNMKNMIETANKDSPMQVDKKTRVSKTYTYDAGEDFLNRKVDASFRQLMEISPAAKNQVFQALRTVKPGFKVVEVNQQSQGVQNSSAYATSWVSTVPFKTIIDTGAGGNIISQDMLRKIKRNIQEPARVAMITADGTSSLPLGIVHNIPITFGPGTEMMISAIVVNTDTYDMVLGNGWISEVRGIIDVYHGKMEMTVNDNQFEIPIDIKVGITKKEEEEDQENDYPDLEDDLLEEEHDDYMVTQLKTTPKRRSPSRQEKAEMHIRIMQDQRCSLCEARVYCAEMMCTCPETWMFEYEKRWSDAYPKAKPKRSYRREEKYQPPIWTGEQAEGPWSKKNPHPFGHYYQKEKRRSSYTNIWKTFWDNVKHVGKRHFWKDRRFYERGCRWDQVNPNDIAAVLRQVDPDWRYEEPIEDWRTDWHSSNKITPQYNVVAFKKKNEETTSPRQEKGSAGIDLASTVNIVIPPWEMRLVGTGMQFQIPEGYYGQLHARSSLALKGLHIRGGVIDANYRGEIQMMLANHDPREPLYIYKGNYVAQMVIIKTCEQPLQEADELEETPRGQGGFGSTGYNAVVIKKEITEVKHEQQKTDIHGYKIGDVCTKEQKTRIKDLCKKYEGVFAVDFKQIRATKTKYVHDIDTGDHPPIKMKPYRVPPAFREWQQQENKRLEEAGITQKSKSNWSAPCVLVAKKGSKPGEHTLRQCHDYINLNKITKTDTFPLPLIDDILDTLRPKAKWLTVLDMFSGFFQIGLTPSAIEKTAFVTAEGLWEYLRMPFGLKNAPSAFQRMMNMVFHDMIGKNVLIYIDDVTIYSDTFDEHIQVLTEVFKRLQEEGLYIKPSKCTFATDTISLLGFKIDRQGIRTDPEKVSAVRNFPRPTDRTTLRAFLGLANYYRRFIQGYADITRPLNKLLRLDQDFEWTNDQTQAFRTIKLRLCSEPILARPDWNKTFKLYTDASAIGLGAVLSQDDDEGRERVIIYLSRSTTRPERNYGPTQLECLAVVWSIKKLRHYLIGRHFKVVTDHRALKWLMTSRDPVGRMARWVAYLQEYDMEIQYRKGKLNNNADALSRIPRNIEDAQGGAHQ